METGWEGDTEGQGTCVPSSSPSRGRPCSKWEKRELRSETAETAAVCARDSPRLSAGRKDVPPFGEREPPLPKRLASQDWGQPHHLFTRVLSGIWESMNTEQHPFLAVPEGMAAKVGNR